MNGHHWTTTDDEDGFFTAQCFVCGITIIDPQPFDHGLYPLLCDTASTGCPHRITAAPFGAECHHCGERYEHGT